MLRAGARPIYAVGDVHGALAALVRLERRIIEDADDAEGRDVAGGHGTRPLVVMLGDLIDRGPHSAQVLDHVRAPHPHLDRLCLTGNHEFLALAYLDGRVALRDWEAVGGNATLRSLGLEPDFLRAGLADERARRVAVREALGSERIAFLRAMPVLARIGAVVLVHGGVRFDMPLDEQDDLTLTTLRPPFPGHDARPRARVLHVVHGHTAAAAPQIEPGRIGIDTQAWASGNLSALRVEPGRVRLLSSLDADSDIATGDAGS